jgi:hypothetical protein
VRREAAEEEEEEEEEETHPTHTAAIPIAILFYNNTVVSTTGINNTLRKEGGFIRQTRAHSSRLLLD